MICYIDKATILFKSLNPEISRHMFKKIFGNSTLLILEFSLTSPISKFSKYPLNPNVKEQNRQFTNEKLPRKLT